MKKILLLTFLFSILFIEFSFSQRQAERWYFGINAGLNFNSGAPVAVTDGALSTSEGCSSIADANGQILFYTDGITVYNKQHTAMANSGDLMGDVSSTQSALIVPQPDSPSIYYIFTNAADGGANGFRYSIVDLTLDSGRGNVTLKNIPVKTPATEKVSAVGNPNGTGYWVMMHEWGTNGFFAYQLTATGFDTTPVISNVGTVHNMGAIQNTYAQLKFSPNGQKLALGIGYQGIFELFDFDNATGIVSNPVTMPVPGYKCYGVEFSTDNSKLYVTKYDNVNDLYFLDQFDLSSGNGPAIIASEVTISNADVMRQLQLGPDKKIYVAKAFMGALSVVNYPDSIGTACNFVDNAIPLGGNMSALGLPGFVQSYFRPGPIAAFATGDTIACANTCINFSDLSLNQVTSWQWHFYGGTPDTSTQQNPQNICYYASGNYGVTLIVGNAAGFDTLIIANYITVNALPPVSVTLNGDTLRAYNAAAYQWFLNGDTIPGATSNTYVADSTGSYTVAATDSKGCTAISTPIIISGLSDLPGYMTPKIFPVPASDYVIVTFPKENHFAISVQNVLGEAISNLKMDFDKNQVHIDIHNLPAGFYILKCGDHGKVVNAMFIKE